MNADVTICICPKFSRRWPLPCFPPQGRRRVPFSAAQRTPRNQPSATPSLKFVLHRSANSLERRSRLNANEPLSADFPFRRSSPAFPMRLKPGAIRRTALARARRRMGLYPRAASAPPSSCPTASNAAIDEFEPQRRPGIFRAATATCWRKVSPGRLIIYSASTYGHFSNSPVTFNATGCGSPIRLRTSPASAESADVGSRDNFRMRNSRPHIGPGEVPKRSSLEFRLSMQPDEIASVRTDHRPRCAGSTSVSKAASSTWVQQRFSHPDNVHRGQK